METIDLTALATDELRGELCNIVERHYLGLPLPGQLGDDGVPRSSRAALAATEAILQVVRRTGRVAATADDPMTKLRGLHPGHTDQWYAVFLFRLTHLASGADMNDAPELPAR